MEPQAKYIVTGSFMLLFLAAIVSFVIWKSAVDFNAEYQEYYTYATGSVTGLSVGSTVRYQGVPVGEVTNIQIDPTNAERIQITLNLISNVEIRKDATAGLQLQGITGQSYVQIHGGSRDAELLEPEYRGHIPIIEFNSSGIGEFISQMPNILENANETIGRVQILLSDDNQEKVTNILTNMELASANIAEISDTANNTISSIEETVTKLDSFIEDVSIDRPAIVANLNTALESFDETMETISSEVDSLSSSISTTSSNLGITAENISNLSATMEGMLNENNAAISDFAQTGLYELTLLFQDLRHTADNFDHFLNKLEEQPDTLIFGGHRGGIEVPE